MLGDEECFSKKLTRKEGVECCEVGLGKLRRIHFRGAAGCVVSPAERTAGGKALRSGTLVHSKDNTLVRVESEGGSGR